MIDEIALHREELAVLCRRFHVRRLDFFGSAVRGPFDPARSDVDFPVEFDRSHPDALSLTTYLGLEESLEGLFGRPVDLVEPDAVARWWSGNSRSLAKRPTSLCASIKRRPAKSPIFETSSHSGVS